MIVKKIINDYEIVINNYQKIDSVMVELKIKHEIYDTSTQKKIVLEE